MIPSDEGSSKQQKTPLTPKDHDQAEAEEGQRRDANHPWAKVFFGLCKSSLMTENKNTKPESQ